MNNKEKIEKILDDCDDQLENANYHDFIGLPRELYKSLSYYLDTDRGDPIDLAEEICEKIISKI